MLWCTPAAAGDTQYLRGFIHAEKGDIGAAIAVWEPLARNGHLRAQNTLGKLYAEGDGVPVDMARAFTWWTMAARAGDARAQFDIAGMYRDGVGTEMDADRAFDWMMRSAQQGHVPAQLGLVDFYYEGFGVTRDEEEARFWLDVALLSGGFPRSDIAVRLSRTSGHPGLFRIRNRARAWLRWN